MIHGLFFKKSKNLYVFWLNSKADFQICCKKSFKFIHHNTKCLSKNDFFSVMLCYFFFRCNFCNLRFIGTFRPSQRCDSSVFLIRAAAVIYFIPVKRGISHSTDSCLFYVRVTPLKLLSNSHRGFKKKQQKTQKKTAEEGWIEALWVNHENVEDAAVSQSAARTNRKPWD